MKATSYTVSELEILCRGVFLVKSRTPFPVKQLLAFTFTRIHQEDYNP